MSKTRPKSKRPDDQEVRVLTPVHAKLKALALDRKTWLGGLATDILEAYLDQLDAGTDWVEINKASKGDG